MATITLKGDPCETVGSLPAVGTDAPVFTLTSTELGDITLKTYPGKTLILNIFPSIDTSVCAASTRRFNEEAGGMENAIVLCVSADLPFAHSRFCEVEGLQDVIPASTFRSAKFAIDYGVGIQTGPLTGLLARAVIVIDPDGKVAYTELVPEIAQEPDYDGALESLVKLSL
ncbi:MAG: thiol peroxidase [Planctomycetota bacterium]